VVPGTTLVFRVKSRWSADEVSLDALALGKWTPDEIEDAWTYWTHHVPTEKLALFRCGRAMFLCDTGHSQEAIRAIDGVCDIDSVVKKWRYLREARPDFLTRYAPLFQYLERQGVFEQETA
jgi:hypothetical protein